MYKLEIESLMKVYQTGTENLEILSNINLKVEQGITVAITGESGSGKSTLLNMIGGLDDLSSGKIIVNNIEISGLNENELTGYRLNTIAFIFQFHYLLKDFSALENVMIPGLIKKLPKKDIKLRAFSLLEDVGLKERITHYPSELSGGERQRVALARALMNDPELILADEPTGNLDEKNSKNVLNILFDLVNKYNKTMVLVTHDPGITKMANESYRLEHGILKNITL